MKQNSTLVVLLMSVALLGCGKSPVTGGTQGTLRVGGSLLSEVQVTVHQSEGGYFRPIGFGVTATDGSFQLVKNEARGPLVLLPGDYRCTLESAGAPVKIPKNLAKAETTPLRVSWSASNLSLDLEVPTKLIP